jgi:hypothetical protein
MLGFSAWKLQCDELLSNFASNFNLRHYIAASLFWVFVVIGGVSFVHIAIVWAIGKTKWNVPGLLVFPRLELIVCTAAVPGRGVIETKNWTDVEPMNVTSVESASLYTHVSHRRQACTDRFECLRSMAQLPGVTRAAVLLISTGDAAGIALGTIVLVSFPVAWPFASNVSHDAV